MKASSTSGMVAEVARLDELDLGVARRDLIGLLVDPLHQDAGEQELGEHDDPAEAEAAARSRVASTRGSVTPL